MTEKVLYCIPVYYGVVVSLVFQFVVDGADAAWLLWWIMRSHRDEVEPLKTLVGCSLALAIWEIYAAFIASVGLYGAFRRKRFMKSFWKPQLFVWFCHIGICIWYIVVYYQVDRTEQVQDCKDKIREESDDSDVEVCKELVSYQGAPLPYVWLTFILETVTQTAVFYFLWHWRRVLNNYKVVDTEDVAHLTENGHERHEGPLEGPSIPHSMHQTQPSDSSEMTLHSIMDHSTARRAKALP